MKRRSFLKKAAAGLAAGAAVAGPIAALGFLVPNVLLGILLVLEVFSCAS